MSQTPVPYYLQKLVDRFESKKRTNAGYSLRAYARDLGVQAPSLSAVLQRKRGLPISMATDVAAKLSLSPLEQSHFLKSLVREKSRALTALMPNTQNKEEAKVLREEAHYKIIAEWEHYAILTLLDLPKFRANIKSISQRLGLSVDRVELCVSRLIDAGLILRIGSNFKKNQAYVFTSEDVPSRALRASHQETLDMAKQKLESVPIEARDFSSRFIAIDPKRIPELKRLIREFRDEATSVAEEGEPSEIYQLAVQFFPVTQKDSR